MFDLQRFAEETPIPEELAGVSEDVQQSAQDSPVDTNDPNDVKVSYSRFKETLDQRNAMERELAAYRERFGDLNAQQNYQQPVQVQQPQQNYQQPSQDYQQGYQQPQQVPQPQQQSPPIQSLTEDTIKTLEDTIAYGAKQLTGFSDEQVDELSYLDDDDPRIKQWENSYTEQ